MRMRLAIAVIAAAVFSGGCAGWFSRQKLQDLEVRVAELETANAELRRQVDELNTRWQMLQARSSATPPAVAASAGAPMAPAPSAPPPSPQLEVIKLKPKNPAGPKAFTSWPEQPTLRTSNGKVISLPKSASAPMDEEKPSAALGTSANRKARGFDQYQEALKLYGEKRYPEAIVKFQELIADPLAADLHDNMRYWLGECYYDLGEYEQAIKEFTKLADDYPESDKAPDGLFKAGLSYQELGQEEKALATLRELVILYPFSDAARLAEAKIEEWTR